MIKKELFVCLLLFGMLNSVFSEQIELKVSERVITVNGKQAKVLGIAQKDGTFGLSLDKGQRFDVKVQNSLNVPTSIHWHGILLPNNQDGVAFITQFPIYPSTGYPYSYPIVQAGTFFMHSHFSMQEQQLLNAPLILREPEDKQIADQEIVVLLNDFSFKSPLEIFEGLRCNKNKSTMSLSQDKMKPSEDVVDVQYDAFLANYKTLEDPEVHTVKPDARIRLRMINASSATNFFIDLGILEGTAIAVDGSRIEPLKSSQFELGIAQRIDIVVNIPQNGGNFPVLALGEGTSMQTGIVLTTGGNAKSLKLSSQTEKKAGVFQNKQESELRALAPLAAKKVDRSFTLDLGGDMANYVWTINGQVWPEVTPLVVNKDERVEIIFKNKTAMAHPMHLHGHVFEVVEIDGNKFQGAMRDTIVVGPRSIVKIQFDANNPGVWPLHCHLLYHMEAGMLTVLRYSSKDST